MSGDTHPAFVDHWRMRVVGGRRVGKTLLAERLTEQVSSHWIGAQCVANGTPIVIWDQVNSLARPLLIDEAIPSDPDPRCVNAYFIVFDVTRAESLSHASTLAFLKQVSPVTAPWAAVLVGNRCDAVPPRRVVSSAEGQDAAAALGMAYFEASATTGGGVAAAFECLAVQMLAGHAYSSGVPAPMSGAVELCPPAACIPVVFCSDGEERPHSMAGSLATQ
jgi:hypothetical protein